MEVGAALQFNRVSESGQLEGFGLVKSCEKKNAKNGTMFLDMVLSDKDSDISCKQWDYKETVPLPAPNTIIKVRGRLQSYNGADQFIIERFRPVTEDDHIVLSDYVKSSEYDAAKMFDVLCDTANGFHDADIKKVVLALLDDNRSRFLYYPAAEKLHHAMNGGLLYHTLSLVRLAEAVCEVYPFLDRDLLLAGAILHDIAKIREYTVSTAGLVNGHTLEGMLLGHLVMGAEEVGRRCDELGVDETKKILLQHMLISHHGKLEFGAAVRPSFVEAEVLAQIDLFDANLYEMADALKDVKPGEFTPRLWMLDNRRFYNHGRTDVSPRATLIADETKEEQS